MPGAAYALLDKRERAKYSKQMDQVVRLLKQNTDQVAKMTKLLDALVKAMTGGPLSR